MERCSLNRNIPTSENPFVRVGTTLYKIVSQPRLNGGHIKKRIVWNNETLRQDYGKDYLAGVPKYDGFCTVPDHVNYCQVIDNFLNLYEPIGHEPKEGDFSHIQALVRHIFGEQYELGMDYLQLLYLQPVQKLPILLLVSEERNTGKSTFPSTPTRISAASSMRTGQASSSLWWMRYC